MVMSKDVTKPGSGGNTVDAFLSQVAATKPRTDGGRGRILFAMDATASREQTWDAASHTQTEMFMAADALGGLSVQLAFYRGFGEFKVSPWLADAPTLLKMMTSVFCLAGQTQIHKVLKQAINETRKQKLHALIFVGDVVEEDIDALGHLAGELGLLGVPVFVFQEGRDPIAESAFRQIATLTKGAHAHFRCFKPRCA